MGRAQPHLSYPSPLQGQPGSMDPVGPQIAVFGPSTVLKIEVEPDADPPTLPSMVQQQLALPPSTVQQRPPPESLPTANLIPDHMSHKSRLHEYTQRSGTPLPWYQTINEGSDHAPRFRSTVFVDGVSYTSINTHSRRKSAEQDVSQFALGSVIRKMKEEGYSIIHEDMVFCKSILHEFGDKMNIKIPIYSTKKSETSEFVSSLVFNGVTYAGVPARSKKEAEQLGARAVILSLLGNPEFETVLWDVVKSKSKFHTALHKVKDVSNRQNSTLSVDVQNENSTCKEMQVPVVVSQHPSSTSISSVSREQVLQSPLRNAMVIEHANAGVNVPSQGPHPKNEFAPLCFQPSAVCSASEKKRHKKQKKKANKRVRIQAEAASMLPGNQTPFLFRGSVSVPQ